MFVFSDMNISCVVNDNRHNADMPVERGVKIDFDLETTPLEIKTDSYFVAAGSSDNLWVEFFSEYISADEAFDHTYAGGVKIFFTDPPKYFLVDCSLYQNPFPIAPTFDVNKVWRITLSKTADTRGLVIHCNEVEVLNVLLSEELCKGSDDWSTYWNRDVTEIKFKASDTASDSYQIYSPGN